MDSFRSGKVAKTAYDTQFFYLNMEGACSMLYATCRDMPVNGVPFIDYRKLRKSHENSSVQN